MNPLTTLVVDTPWRLSVSEPVLGYGAFENQGGLGGNGMYATAYDVPFDSQRADSGEIFGNAPVFQYDGTVPAYRVIYLQRLANPLTSWDPVNNPYRTIDQMAVDVTAFNGVYDDSGLSQSPRNKDPQLAGRPATSCRGPATYP